MMSKTWATFSCIPISFSWDILSTHWSPLGRCAIDMIDRRSGGPFVTLSLKLLSVYGRLHRQISHNEISIMLQIIIIFADYIQE